MNLDQILRWLTTFLRKWITILIYMLLNINEIYMIFQLTSIWFIIFIFCRFHQALINYGVDEVDIFQTNDLSEKRDMGSVTNTMFALGRAVSEFWRNGTLQSIDWLLYLMLLISTFVDAKALGMEWPLACKEWKGIRKFQWRNWIEIRYDTKWTSHLMVCFNRYHRLLKNGKHHNEIYYHSICVTLLSI